MKQLTILTFLFTLLISCNKNKNALTKLNPHSVEFVQIAKGNLYGNGSEQISKENLLISNNEAWEKLLQKMNSANDVSANFKESDIDFRNYIVVAMFDDIKPGDGYSIGIKNIVENKNNITVTIENLRPDGVLTAVMTQPFQIVKIPKTSKPILFQYGII